MRARRPGVSPSASVAVHGATARIVLTRRVCVHDMHDASLIDQLFGDEVCYEGGVFEALGTSSKLTPRGEADGGCCRADHRLRDESGRFSPGYLRLRGETCTKRTPT